MKHGAVDRVTITSLSARALALALLSCAISTAAQAQAARTVTVQLLAINDLHGALQPTVGPEGQVNGVAAGGVEYLATHLKRAAQDNPNSILVGAGDLMGASPLISSLFNDAPTIEALNAMHMDLTAIGNHELDRGAASFLHRLDGTCPRPAGCPADRKAAPATYQYLAANVLKGDGETLEPATAVRRIGGVKIGFIGETLKGTGAMISADASQGLRFLEESQVANAAAAQFERQGVHAIVLLIHQGGEQAPAAGAPADPNSCVNFQGALTDILPKLSPSIKVVITGHTHQVYNCRIGGRVVTSAGAFGRLFTRVTLTVDAGSDRVLRAEAVNEVVSRDVPKDQAQTAILKRYAPEADRLAGRLVGSSTGEIGRGRNAAEETPLGDVIADSYLAGTAEPGQGGAEVAFINSGGIRASVAGLTGPDGSRPVTYGDVYRIQPFADNLVTRTLTGAQLRLLLEQQFHDGGRNDILQVSRGFTYRYRKDAPAGQHVVEGSIALNGRPVAPDQPIRVATTNFLAEGGNGYTVFGEGSDPVTGDIDVDVVVRYFQAHSPVAPGPEDRILRAD